MGISWGYHGDNVVYTLNDVLGVSENGYDPK